MARSFCQSPVLLALLVPLPGCTCETPPSTKPSAPAVMASAEPKCPSLSPTESWQTVRADFFEAQVPSSFRETKIDEGRGYRDDAHKRRIQFSSVQIPLGRLGVTAAVDKLSEGVRGQASSPELKLTLDAVHKGGTAAEPLRYYLATSPDRAFVQGLVGKAMPDGRLHAVLIIFEHEGAMPACALEHAKVLMETVSIPSSVVTAASASTQPIVPTLPVRFTARALSELRRQVRPGETVWVGVTREGSEVSYVLDVGQQVPPNADVGQLEGVAVAVDRASRPLLEGVQIDFVPGQGLVFRAPNAKPRRAPGP